MKITLTELRKIIKEEIKKSNKKLLNEKTTIEIGKLFKEQLKQKFDQYMKTQEQKFDQYMKTQGLQFRSLGFNISHETIETYLQNNKISYIDLFMLSDEEVGNHLNNMLTSNFSSQTKEYT